MSSVTQSREFDQLVSLHKDAVYRQLLRMCGNHADAEDVLSDSLLNAYRSLATLRDQGHFQAWLVQIGRRLCGRLKKQESLHAALLMEEMDVLRQQSSMPSELEQAVYENELRNCLYHALDALPAHYRSVYELRDLEELTAEETAVRLGITVANVKARLHRARAKVRAAVDEELKKLA